MVCGVCELAQAGPPDHWRHVECCRINRWCHLDLSGAVALLVLGGLSRPADHDGGVDGALLVLMGP